MVSVARMAKCLILGCFERPTALQICKLLSPISGFSVGKAIFWLPPAGFCPVSVLFRNSGRKEKDNLFPFTHLKSKLQLCCESPGLYPGKEGVVAMEMPHSDVPSRNQLQKT